MAMSKINQCDILHQRNKFLQIIEELRYCRKVNKSLEAKVDSLQEEKLKLEHANDDTSSKLCKMTEHYNEIEQTLIRCQNKDKKHETSDENYKKLKIALEASELTIAGLKNEIITFNSIKNVLEKKLAECEQNLSVSQKAESLFTARTEQVQIAMEKLNKQLDQARDSQVRLERNISVVASINKNLLRVQEHQKCIIVDLKKEKSGMEHQAVTLQRKLKEVQLSAQDGKEAIVLRDEVGRLCRENASLAKLKKSMEVELCENKRITNEAIDSTRVANDLLNKSDLQHEKTVTELQNKVELCMGKIKSLQNNPVKIERDRESSKNDLPTTVDPSNINEERLSPAFQQVKSKAISADVDTELNQSAPEFMETKGECVSEVKSE